MVPVLTRTGRSFKGAALYYLHDKRRAGEAERLTSDRVAWTQTVNLPTDDAEKAWRMMATTALKADELKAAAGVKATGRKLTTPAMAYSLAWHPTEQPTREEQIEAARETLKLLGLSEHQALIVSHTDTPHAHVHVIVNRVHPAEGRAATLSNSKLILSQWAQDYEERRGKILCPKREQNNARRQAEYVREPRIPRTTREFTRAAANGNIKATIVRTEQKQRDAHLAAAGRAMHDRHRREWDELKAGYRAGKDRLYAEADARKEAAAAETRAAFKPQWRDLFRQQRDARRAFEWRETTAIGTLRNMLATARELREQGTAAPLLHVVWGVISQAERRNALEAAQQREQKALAAKVSAAVKAERERIRRETKATADRQRAEYLKRCATLRAEQDQQRQDMKGAWQRRNEERRAAYAPLRDRRASWSRLEEMGRQAQQGREVAPGRHLGRGRGPGVQ